MNVTTTFIHIANRMTAFVSLTPTLKITQQQAKRMYIFAATC